LGHFHLHPIPGGEADEALAHLPGNGRQYLMFVVQFDAKHRSGENRNDTALDLNRFFHSFLYPAFPVFGWPYGEK